MTLTLHIRFLFLCFILVGQFSHPLVILSMQTYLMHVYIHRHFIYLGYTDWDIFIQEKMGDRYWQAQDIRKAAKVNVLQEFWNGWPMNFEFFKSSAYSYSAVQCCTLIPVFSYQNTNWFLMAAIPFLFPPSDWNKLHASEVIWKCYMDCERN